LALTRNVTTLRKLLAATADRREPADRGGMSFLQAATPAQQAPVLGGQGQFPPGYLPRSGADPTPDIPRCFPGPENAPASPLGAPGALQDGLEGLDEINDPEIAELWRRLKEMDK
jgi:hypothetical protein